MASYEKQATGSPSPKPGRRDHRFEAVGLYIEPARKDQSRQYDFYRACGYNYLEFCEVGFSRRPDLLPQHYADMAQAVSTAQNAGFKVWLLILAGMKQWKGPEETGNGGTFCALKEELLKERLAFIKQAVQGLHSADGFAFFAGDPGGDPEGRSTVQDCINMAREVHEIVRSNAPKARFAVNLWAIAEWDGFPTPFGLEFWRKQVLLSKAVAEEKRFLGSDCGVVFSLDNYYRSLTLACYADARLKPDLFPSASEVRRLHDSGVRPIYGWPYFLVDEIDDGFITPNNVASGGQAGAETRYLRAIIDHAHQIGLDGLVANASSLGVTAEPLNIYAFGRMCHSPELTPERALDEFAGLIADRKTRSSLALILRFIENHSNWHNSLPTEYRLKDLDCGDVTNATVALERLERVVPRRTSPIPLPEPPDLYLKRLRKRLESIAAGNIGGVAPIVRMPGTSN